MPDLIYSDGLRLLFRELEKEHIQLVEWGDGLLWQLGDSTIPIVGVQT